MLAANSDQNILSQVDFEAIRDFIHKKSGLWFPDNKKYLIENRLRKRMDELGLANCRDYLYRIKYDNEMKEFDTFMDLITINETSFFRNLPQLTTFKEIVLPKLIEKNGAQDFKRLKIWSAGCSTGEEPYTLAIILHEAIPDIKDWKIEIIANDISQSALYTARMGVYQKPALRNTDQKILLKYFELDGDSFRIRDEIRRLVRIKHLNLNDPIQVATITDCDVIFCRNVMIYFSNEAKKNLVRQFYKSLKPDGFLFIGHSETLHGISRAFELEYLKQSLIYRKTAVEPPNPNTAETDVRKVHEKNMDTLAKIRKLLANQINK